MASGPEPSVQDYAEGAPSPPLAAHVVCWSVHWVDALSHSYLHRSAPNGSVELVCEVGGRPLVVGPQTGPLVRTLSPGATTVSLRLRPESAAAVLGLPAYELVDQIVPLDDVLPATRFYASESQPNPSGPSRHWREPSARNSGDAALLTAWWHSPLNG